MDLLGSSSFILMMSFLQACGSDEGESIVRPDPATLFDKTIIDPMNIDPANFVTVANNPFFPLLEGSNFNLKGVSEDGEAVDVTYEVLSEKKVILGVSTTAVRVQESEAGAWWKIHSTGMPRI